MIPLKALFLTVVLSVVSFSTFAADPPTGRITGGIRFEFPGWFKKSFLVIAEDVEEAKEKGRHVMLFMHLVECPYCARLLKENFHEGETKEFIEKNFDVIAIDIRGSSSVEWVDGKTYSEQELARKLGVKATPTMVFFDTQGKQVLQLNGYRAPSSFRLALDFVQGKHYQKQTLLSYVERHSKAPAYQFRQDPRFSERADFKGHATPLAVIFEDKDCTDCNEFHDKVLSHPEVKPELAKFTIVRLDAHSTNPITDLEGRRTTPREWASRLNLFYRPGVLLINEGEIRTRMEGMQYHFHFKELLRYVSGKYYHQYATPSLYNAARRDEILKQGGVIDFGR